MVTHYLETGSTDPCFNLAFEEFVLEHKLSGDWLILWQNENTVVVGLNQNTAEEIDPSFVRERSINVVRRRTGGGAVYHDLGNLNYSFITDLGDASLLTIKRFTQPVCRALEAMGVHAETSGRNDITVGEKKISGVAQRIYKDRILHHGTLLFDSDTEMVSRALHVDSEKFTSKSAKSVRSRVGNIRSMLPQDMEMNEFWSHMLTMFAEDGLEEEALDSAELQEVARIADERYRSWEWTYGRSPEYDFKNKTRFPGGTMEVSLTVRSGVIEEIGFHGDFMAQQESGPACRALKGLPFRREEIARALSALPLSTMFGAITRDEILSVMFGVNARCE